MLKSNNNYTGKVFIKYTIYLSSVPATIPVSSTYVTSAIAGIYKSGEFMSSLGGSYPSICPFCSDRLTSRDHGRCLHGNNNNLILLATYELFTLK